MVTLLALIAVVALAATVVYLLLRHRDRRRGEEQRLAAMGTATARILHQIKNPLQTILLHAELLEDPAIAEARESRAQICGAIVGEAQRLAAMLTELSLYAAGARRHLTLTPLPVHELLRELARTRARDGSVEVEASGIAESVVLADAYYLRQALENLIANACDAMEGAETRRLTLAAEVRGGTVDVQVADTGPGIPSERLERLFEPFGSDKGKGMGLGLAICRDIVTGHGGRIEVQSRPGAGTCFHVLLPVHAPVTPGAANPSVSVHGGVS